ncbi:MAG: NUDIX domain-containing protein [Acidobacteriota bacterium]
MEPEFRRAARLVAVDFDRRILLFRYAPPSGEWFWATPGGGLEHGESFEQAAQREAAEELGVKQVELEPLWEAMADFLWGECTLRQQEQYFLLRFQPQEFAKEVPEVHRQENIVETRWWTIAELESSTELIFPEGLAKNLRNTLGRNGLW